MVEDASVNTGAVVWPTAEVAADAVRRMQLKLHRWASRQWLTRGHGTWRAGCGESRMSGSAGGLGKRVGSNPDTAPQADPTVTVLGGWG